LASKLNKNSLKLRLWHHCDIMMMSSRSSLQSPASTIYLFKNIYQNDQN